MKRTLESLGMYAASLALAAGLLCQSIPLQAQCCWTPIFVIGWI